MKLIKPLVKILQITEDPLQLIELAGRTCYKSEEKITQKSAPKFIKQILTRGHESVIEHGNATVMFICDRGVTHEIVRHRLASYSQESTRYCNYGNMDIKFILPCDFELNNKDEFLLQAIESHYNYCLSLGRSPQQARYFLPNGLKTEIIMTANFREWRHFFKLRTAPVAHPQMQEVAKLLLVDMRKRVPVIFDSVGAV